MENDFKPGDLVRVIEDPGKRGVVIGEPGSRGRINVMFNNVPEEVYPDLLEKYEDKNINPETILQKEQYGGVRDLRGAITYYRLSGRLANLIYSLNATNTDFYAYQFKPVLHFLESPCNGILIADEVGLGKTIEAGLIWTELRVREDAKRLLVVCPAMLREKWKIELSDRFGVNADIVDAGELLEFLYKAEKNPDTEFALVASVQGIRPVRNGNEKDNKIVRLSKYIEEHGNIDILFDMVIVDEAHYLRNKETQNNKLGQQLRSVANYFILLSATPVQLKNEDLFNLLHLLDEELFRFEHTFEDQLRMYKPIVNLRDKVLKRVISREIFEKNLRNAAEKYSRLKNNEQIKYLIENLPTDDDLSTPDGRSKIADQLDRINPLSKVITRTRKRDVLEMRVEREPRMIDVEMYDVEKIFYNEVTEKVAEFCRRKGLAEGLLLSIPQRQMTSCIAAACRGWQNRVAIEKSKLEEVLYENYGDINENEEDHDNINIGVLLEQLIKLSSEIGDFETLKRQDSKYEKLLEVLKIYWENNKGKKVVLFSCFRLTLEYLAERLKEDGIESVLVYGGIDKQQALNDFKIEGGPNILLSSEVASEGVDLQFSSFLINYDLPWNPMRIEQRIGRIDRIGQVEEKILINNLLHKGTIDRHIYDRLLKRLDIFKNALGGMEVVIGKEIQELSYELLSHKLTEEQIKQRIDSSAMAIENNNKIREELESKSVQLLAHGDYIQNKVKAANELGRYISGLDLYNYVKDFFDNAYSGTKFIEINEKGKKLYKCILSINAKVKFSDFLDKHKLSSKTSIHKQDTKLLFENKMGMKLYGVEVVAQDHPLIRFVSEQLKDNQTLLSYSVINAVEIDRTKVGDMPEGYYIFAIHRETLIGSTDMERLSYVAYHIPSGQYFYNDKVEDLINKCSVDGIRMYNLERNDLYEERVKYFNKCRDELDKCFDEFCSISERENIDRINSMVSTLEEKCKSEEKKCNELIKKLEQDEKSAKLIPATMARYNKSIDRFKIKIAELRAKEKLRRQTNFVTGGLINIK